MSKKAKTASKNNPLSRQSGRVYMHNNKKIRPVMVISMSRKILAAEYEDNGEVILSPDGNEMRWDQVAK
jgi:hypothetical protein